MLSSTLTRYLRASVLQRRVSIAGRAALSLALAVALVPVPIGRGLLPDRADAATIPVPYASILNFPENPHSVRAPAAIAVASDGTIFVADTGKDRIRVLTAAGALLASWGKPGSAPGQLSAPEALALGADNRVYVADSGNNRVEVFERDGTFVRAFGGPGTGNGQLNRPGGIAVDGQGRVLVSDTFNARVERFTSAGVYVDTMGSRGGNPEQFDSPRGIAVDPDGNVYVVDTNKHYVKKFDSTHAFLLNWGWPASGSGTSRYANPMGITLAPDGLSLMIADTGNCRVERCDLNGNAMASVGAGPVSNAIGRFSSPGSAALMADGSWVVADTGNSRIQVRNGAGTWQTPWETSSTATGLLSSPQAVASNASGTTYYVADTANSRVLRYDPEGAYLGSIAETGSGNGQVNSPAGLLVLADGTVMVADTGNNRIERFDATGAFLGTIGVGLLTAPRGLALSDANVLFVADTGNNRIERFDLDNANAATSVGSFGSSVGLFNAPRGVAVLGNSVWVADTGNDRLQSFNVYTEVFSLQVVGSGMGDGQVRQPMSVAIDGSDVVVADTGNDRIQRFDAATRTWLLSYYGSSGGSAARMHGPASVASAPNGRTLVAERDACRIRVLVAETTPPLTTISGVPAGQAQSVTFSLSATDSTAGVAATYYRIGSVTTSGTGPVTISTEGSHAVAYWSVDRAGNVEPERSATFTIDRTPPVTTSNRVPVDGGATAIKLTASDTVGGSGVAHTNYQLDGAGWVEGTTINVPAPVSGSTLHKLEFRSEDAAGNIETPHITDFTVNSQPTITVGRPDNGTIDPGTASYALGDSPVYSVKANLGYHIADVLVDDVSVGAVPTYTFTNVTASHTISATFAIDDPQPSTTTLSPSSASIRYGQTVTLAGTVSPHASGVVIIQRRIGSGNWAPLTTASLDSSGAYNRTISKMGVGTWKFRAVYAGTSTVASSTSDTITVSVKALSKTALRASATNIPLGKTVKLFGTVSPKAAGQRVTLRRRIGSGSWSNLSTATVGSSGAYTRTISKMSRGTWYFQAVYAGSGTLAGSTSATMRVIVR